MLTHTCISTIICCRAFLFLSGFHRILQNLMSHVCSERPSIHIEMHSLELNTCDRSLILHRITDTETELRGNEA